MRDIAKITKKHMEDEDNGNLGGTLRQVILGGQDGLVNVLGIILGVAVATKDANIVIIAGLAATFAESISMAAVAYTSSRAEQDHYRKMVEIEKWEIENLPDVEREEIVIVYRNKGFKGKGLADVVKTITSDKKLWLDVMMQEELGLTKPEDIHPVKEGIVVGLSAIFGSLVPLIPFLLVPLSVFSIDSAFWGSLGISVIVLFAAGMVKGKLTTGRILHDGVEMAVIGGLAAIVGYGVGVLAGVAGL